MKRAEVNMLIQCMHAVHNGCVRDATNAHDQLLDMCEPEPAVPRAPPLAVGMIVQLVRSLALLEPQFPVVPIGTRGKIISFTAFDDDAKPIVHFMGILGTRAVPSSFLEFIGYDTSAPAKHPLPAAPLVAPTTRVPHPGKPPSSGRLFTEGEANNEYKKLLDYFNSPEGYDAHGRDGDYNGTTPAETAIRGMKRSTSLYKSLVGQNSRIDAYEKILRGILDSIDVTLGVKPRPVGSPFSGLDYITLKANIEKVLE